MADEAVIETASPAAGLGAAPQQAVAVQNAAPPATAARTGEILPPRRRRKRIVLPLILLAGLGGGGYEGYRWFVEGRFLVSTDDAYVKANTSILAAKVAGYVTLVPVADNSVVKKGQVLARIDAGDYDNAVEAAAARIATQDATVARIGRQVAAGAAMVDQAKAQLLSAKAEATRTATEFDRADALMRSTYGTQQRLDQARADRDRASAAVASAAAAVTSADSAIDVLKAQKVEAEKVGGELETALAMAERNLAFTSVKAPFDGTVGNKSVEPGQYVQPGTRLMALVPLDSAYVEANFKETQVGRLKPGQRVTIRPDAYGDRDVTGTVESLAPASGAEFSMLPPENATGNFTKIVQRLPVRIAIPAEVAREGILRPGLSVVIDVHTRDESLPAPSLARALGVEPYVGPIVERVGAAWHAAAVAVGLERSGSAQAAAPRAFPDEREKLSCVGQPAQLCLAER